MILRLWDFEIWLYATPKEIPKSLNPEIRNKNEIADLVKAGFCEDIVDFVKVGFCDLLMCGVKRNLKITKSQNLKISKSYREIRNK